MVRCVLRLDLKKEASRHLWSASSSCSGECSSFSAHKGITGPPQPHTRLWSATPNLWSISFSLTCITCNTLALPQLGSLLPWTWRHYDPLKLGSHLPDSTVSLLKGPHLFLQIRHVSQSHTKVRLFDWFPCSLLIRNRSSTLSSTPPFAPYACISALDKSGNHMYYMKTSAFWRVASLWRRDSSVSAALGYGLEEELGFSKLSTLALGPTQFHNQ